MTKLNKLMSEPTIESLKSEVDFFAEKYKEALRENERLRELVYNLSGEMIKCGEGMAALSKCTQDMANGMQRYLQSSTTSDS